jgi:hypothetical protein
MTKHTKGEWKVGMTLKVEDSFSDCDTIIQEITDSDGVFVACVNDSEEANANANLISSAPDLLKACKTVLKYQQYDNKTKVITYSEMITELEQAIKKAEGC